MKKSTTILLFAILFVFSCKKDKTIDNAKLAVKIYKDIPNKEDGLLVDVYDAETQYKTYFYGSFNDKGLPKDIKSIVLENKQSDTLHNYILDENGKMQLVYSSMKNGTKLGSITKITEDENLLTLNFYDYDWNSLTEVFIETINLDNTEETNGERLEDENEEIKFDLFGLEEKRKKIAIWLEEKIIKTNEKYAGFINSICSKTNGALCGSSTLGLGGALEDFNKYVKELTQGDVNVSLNDFLKSPTSEDYTPSENEFIPSSPTATTNSIPELQTPINQAPTCVITNPSDGDIIPASETITVAIEAADIDGSISTIDLILDGLSKGIKIPGIDGKVNYIIPAYSLFTGSHYFYAIAKDDKKANKLSKAIIFKVENDVLPTSGEGTANWFVNGIDRGQINIRFQSSTYEECGANKQYLDLYMEKDNGDNTYTSIGRIKYIPVKNGTFNLNQGFGCDDGPVILRIPDYCSSDVVSSTLKLSGNNFIINVTFPYYKDSFCENIEENWQIQGSW